MYPKTKAEQMIDKTFPLLVKLMDSGLELARQLLLLLDGESRILRQNRHAASLNHLTEQKQQLVSQLNQFSDQLGQILASEKLDNGREGLQQYFEIARQKDLQTATAVERWSEFMTISERCRMLNEQNGASIALLTRHVQRSLQILKGKPQTTSTYGPDGTTRSGLYSRTLVSV